MEWNPITSREMAEGFARLACRANETYRVFEKSPGRWAFEFTRKMA